jgi:hypothetical protein
MTDLREEGHGALVRKKIRLKTNHKANLKVDAPP